MHIGVSTQNGRGYMIYTLDILRYRIDIPIKMQLAAASIAASRS